MTTSSKKLALYHFDGCPYCAITRKVIDTLGLNIELKNIKTNRQNRIDLQNGGKKTQVPCLRIEASNGDVKWLYESSDIIKFLSA